jgi:hypothetical protein
MIESYHFYCTRTNGRTKSREIRRSLQKLCPLAERMPRPPSLNTKQSASRTPRCHVTWITTRVQALTQKSGATATQARQAGGTHTSIRAELIIPVDAPEVDTVRRERVVCALRQVACQRRRLLQRRGGHARR